MGDSQVLRSSGLSFHISLFQKVIYRILYHVKADIRYTVAHIQDRIGFLQGTL